MTDILSADERRSAYLTAWTLAYTHDMPGIDADVAQHFAGLRAVERAVVAKLTATAGKDFDAIVYVDQNDLDKDGNWDTFIAKHASEWHEGMRFNTPLYTADQLREVAARCAATQIVMDHSWIDGAAPHPYNSEWFIAETTCGDRVVLKALPKIHTYDYKTADETHIGEDLIARWMQFQDSEFIPFKSDAHRLAP